MCLMIQGNVKSPLLVFEWQTQMVWGFTILYTVHPLALGVFDAFTKCARVHSCVDRFQHQVIVRPVLSTCRAATQYNHLSSRKTYNVFNPSWISSSAYVWLPSLTDLFDSQISNNFLITLSLYLWPHTIHPLVCILDVPAPCKLNHLHSHHWYVCGPNYVHTGPLRLNAQLVFISEVLITKWM